MGSFKGARSSLSRSVTNITSRCCNASPQDLSGNSILPHESRTLDIAAHTVISNQDGTVTKLLKQGVFITPKFIGQQQQRQLLPQRDGDRDGSSYLDLDVLPISHANSSIVLNLVPSN